MPLLTRGRLTILSVTLLYTFGFGVSFLVGGNYEFLWYVLVMLVIVGLVGATLQKTQFPDWTLWLLSLWGLLHMAGGGIRIGDTVLYGTMVWPVFDGGADFVLLKYDQLVHAYGFGVAALAVESILVRSMMDVASFWIGTTAVLAAMGLSVINELVEFAALITIAETGVGGFYNLELDLVFNTIGAIAAIVAYHMFRPAA